MIIRDNEQRHARFADSLIELEQWLQSKPRDWGCEESRRNRPTASWDLNAGYDGALKLARTGWSEGMRDILFSAAEVVPQARTSTLRYDVAGERPDVARYNAGDPLHMISRKKQKQNHPVVHLMVNLACSSGVGAKQFVTYGGALVALVDQIENTGRRVELDVISVVATNRRLIVGWKVKQAGDALDLAAVAYSVAHPAAFRRLAFAMYERTPKRCESMSYGYPETMNKADAEMLDAGEALLLDGVGLAAGGVSTAEANRRLAKNVEKALGIQILQEGE